MVLRALLRPVHSVQGKFVLLVLPVAIRVLQGRVRGRPRHHPHALPSLPLLGRQYPDAVSHQKEQGQHKKSLQQKQVVCGHCRAREESGSSGKDNFCDGRRLHHLDPALQHQPSRAFEQDLHGDRRSQVGGKRRKRRGKDGGRRAQLPVRHVRNFPVQQLLELFHIPGEGPGLQEVHEIVHFQERSSHEKVAKKGNCRR